MRKHIETIRSSQNFTLINSFTELRFSLWVSLIAFFGFWSWNWQFNVELVLTVERCSMNQGNCWIFNKRMGGPNKSEGGGVWSCCCLSFHSCSFKLKGEEYAPFHRRTFDYSRSHWNDFGDHQRDDLWKDNLETGCFWFLLILRCFTGFCFAATAIGGFGTWIWPAGHWPEIASCDFNARGMQLVLFDLSSNCCYWFENESVCLWWKIIF